MNSTWEIKTLSEVCDLRNGFAFKSKSYVDSSNTLNIRMSNIRPDGSFDPEHNIRFLPDEMVEEYSQYRLEEGDLVIAMTDMAGDPKILGVPTLVKNLNGRTFLQNQRVGKLEKFSSDIFIPYLRYYLSSPIIKNYYKSKGAGGLQINISKKEILTAQIPVPLLEEQKQIVDILDQAFAVIDQAQANIQQNIQNAQDLFQSKLNQIFSQQGVGWEEKTLGDVCENLDSRRIPITKNKRKEGEIPYYGASGIVDYVDDFIFDEDLLLVSEDGANLLARTYPIAFSVSGKTWVNNHAHALKFESKDSQVFIEYYLNSIKLDNYISGMAQPKLNQKKLNSIQIPFPDIDIQKATVKEIDALKSNVTELEQAYKLKIINLEELKKSLLQKAFSGELTQDKQAA